MKTKMPEWIEEIDVRIALSKKAKMHVDTNNEILLSALRIAWEALKNAEDIGNSFREIPMPNSTYLACSKAVDAMSRIRDLGRRPR